MTTVGEGVAVEQWLSEQAAGYVAGQEAQSRTTAGTLRSGTEAATGADGGANSAEHVKSTKWQKLNLESVAAFDLTEDEPRVKCVDSSGNVVLCVCFDGCDRCSHKWPGGSSPYSRWVKFQHQRAAAARVKPLCVCMDGCGSCNHKWPGGSSPYSR